jgi:hypothetical protein
MTQATHPHLRATGAAVDEHAQMAFAATDNDAIRRTVLFEKLSKLPVEVSILARDCRP